jgi:hypothetical protein
MKNLCFHTLDLLRSFQFDVYESSCVFALRPVRPKPSLRAMQTSKFIKCTPGHHTCPPRRLWLLVVAMSSWSKASSHPAVCVCVCVCVIWLCTRLIKPFKPGVVPSRRLTCAGRHTFRNTLITYIFVLTWIRMSDSSSLPFCSLLLYLLCLCAR